jgi:hypothetical protein
VPVRLEHPRYLHQQDLGFGLHDSRITQQKHKQKQRQVAAAFRADGISRLVPFVFPSLSLNLNLNLNLNRNLSACLVGRLCLVPSLPAGALGPSSIPLPPAPFFFGLSVSVPPLLTRGSPDGPHTYDALY